MAAQSALGTGHIFVINMCLCTVGLLSVVYRTQPKLPHNILEYRAAIRPGDTMDGYAPAIGHVRPENCFVWLHLPRLDKDMTWGLAIFNSALYPSTKY